MGKHKDLIIDNAIADMESMMSPEAVRRANAEAEDEIRAIRADPNRCICGGTFVLVGRSQDAKAIHEVYECDLCKANKYESRAKE